jgi:hypothetical protein
MSTTKLDPKRPWQRSSDATLRKLLGRGMDAAAIAVRMRRHVKSVCARIGFLKRRDEHFTERDERFRAMWMSPAKRAEIAAKFGITESQARRLRAQLGLPMRGHQPNGAGACLPMRGHQASGAEPCPDYRVLLSDEWRKRGLSSEDAHLRASIFTIRGAAHELRALQQQGNA